MLDGLQRAVDEAERDFTGLVIWQTEASRSRPAPISPARWACCRPATSTGFEAMVANFQATSQRIKYSLVPVVAAVRGMALGGGCEFLMHSARTVAALESYIGLVEAGVGLLPAGGGLKEIAVRASRSRRARAAIVFAELKTYFETVAMAKVSTSRARSARNWACCATTDVVVFNAFELLYVAKAAGARAGRSRLPPAAAGARHPGRRRRRHRDASR